MFDKPNDIAAKRAALDRTPHIVGAPEALLRRRPPPPRRARRFRAHPPLSPSLRCPGADNPTWLKNDKQDVMFGAVGLAFVCAGLLQVKNAQRPPPPWGSRAVAPARPPAARARHRPSLGEEAEAPLPRFSLALARACPRVTRGPYIMANGVAKYGVIGARVPSRLARRGRAAEATARRGGRLTPPSPPPARDAARAAAAPALSRVGPPRSARGFRRAPPPASRLYIPERAAEWNTQSPLRQPLETVRNRDSAKMWRIAVCATVALVAAALAALPRSVSCSATSPAARRRGRPARPTTRPAPRPFRS